jgi:hypothetical protein
MAEVINVEKYTLPNGIKGISEESFWNYLDWEVGAKRIAKVKKAFEPELFSLTRYSDERIPDETKDRTVTVENERFAVRTKPTTKTPAYKDVIAGLSNYLSLLKEQRAEEDVLRKGVRTIEGELYTNMNMLKSKLNRDKQDITSGKEGVEQKLLGKVSGVNLVEVGESIPPSEFSFSFNMDYSQLTDEVASLYWDALNFLKAWGGYAANFKQEVKEDSLQVLGGKPKEPVAVKYPFEGIVFYHQLEPRERTSYSKVFESFMKQAPLKITKKSSIGDFRKIEMYLENEEQLWDKNLLDENFLSDYNPRQRDGDVYVRIDGVRDRLSKYSKGKPFLEQNFTVRRK